MLKADKYFKKEHEGEYFGETIGNGMLDHFSSYNLLWLKNSKLLFLYSGEGGKFLRELNKQHNQSIDNRNTEPRPGYYYHTGIDDFRRCKENAKEIQKNCFPLAVVFMQGEASNEKIERFGKNLSSEEFKALYSEDLLQLSKDYKNDLGNRNLPLLIYQTSTRSNVAQAQLELIDNNDNIYISTPLYFLEGAQNSKYLLNGKIQSSSINSVHLNADSQRWLGEYFGKVLNIINKKGERKPLHPLKVNLLTKKKIEIKYYVPVKTLRFNSMLSTQKSYDQTSLYGFSIYNYDEKVKIRDIIIENESVIISMDKNLDGDVKIKYGFNSEVNGIYLKIDKITETDDILYIRIHNSNFNDIIKLQEEGKFKVKYNENIGSVSSYKTDNDYVTLILKRNDLKGKFSKGDIIEFHRLFNYGNISDSDMTKSYYRYGTGPKAGKHYPLENYSLVYEWKIK